jgi:hypothetical protein
MIMLNFGRLDAHVIDGRFRESEAFRRVFESVVRACLQAGLVDGETFVTDASVIEADARIARRSEADSTPCALKAQCTKAGYRALSVNAYEEARQQVAALSKTDDFKKSLCGARLRCCSLT